jgi:protein-S-isoprenylcysteine O-methyltransferase Ste14
MHAASKNPLPHIIGRMLQRVAFVELLLCWVVWTWAFWKPRQQSTTTEKVAGTSSSKWGIALESIGFACAWAYVRPVGFEKSTLPLLVSMIIAPLSAALAWWATRHLGKQWRYAAALREDHELITTGPYSLVRNPIYTSMLGMLLATGAGYTWWPMFVAALIFFVIGTEMRVRSEERLLAERFKDSFAAYRARVPAYIPFVR